MYNNKNNNRDMRSLMSDTLPRRRWRLQGEGGRRDGTGLGDVLRLVLVNIRFGYVPHLS